MQEQEEGKGGLSQTILEAMRKNNVNLEQLENLSGVSERHLSLLLEEKYEKLPAAPYVRGYIMKVAEALELDGKRLWKGYLKDNEVLRKSGKNDTLPGNRFLSKNSLIRVLILIVIVIVIVLIAAIRLFRLDNPNVEFKNLEDEITTVGERIFVIKGSVDPKFKLTLAEEEVMIGEEGDFEKEVILEPGFNTFMFSAKKVLGKEHKFPKQIYFEESGLKTGGEQSTSTNVAPKDN
tara:strand:- start:2114 stop:2818 length:705 start_codon:yes stop_codon:yes gene_type:complete